MIARAIVFDGRAPLQMPNGRDTLAFHRPRFRFIRIISAAMIAIKLALLESAGWGGEYS